MRRVVRLTEADCLPEAAAESLAGTLLDESSHRLLLRSEDCDVFKPDGSLLLALRPRAIPPAACRAAYPVLRRAARNTDNRGMAAGLGRDGLAKERLRKLDGTLSTQTRSVRFRPVTAAGYLSNTSEANGVVSGIAGYFDRSARFPYCRQTAYSIENPEWLAAAQPLLRAADAAFAASVPDRHAAQMALVRRTSPDFVIPGTAFTTLTVNRNWQTAVHKDVGDLKAGFGVLAVLRAGRFSGCHLCFPRFRVAVDLRTRDVLCCDVHEFHGNTPIVGVPGAFDRVSLVFYYREAMHECGSAAEELETAKRRTSRRGIGKGRRAGG